MSGGAWERVAAYYDNGHKNLNTYGKSSSHGGSETQYFTLDEGGRAIINPDYEKYWEAYAVSEEEKSNSIKVGEETGITQDVLWGTSKTSEEAEKKRHDLTEETWNNLEKVKGIGMNEVGESWSYRGLVNGTIDWKVNTEDTTHTYGKAWNSDYVLIGSASIPFLNRGGSCYRGTYAGVLSSDANSGGAWYSGGFRPVLTF